jgi:hypothetical protein
MPVAASSLATAGRVVADLLTRELNSGEDNDRVRVVLGTPNEASTVGGQVHALNLFVFRVDPGGFQADVGPGDPWLVRMHCLLTAFATTEDGVGAGENDLRLLGEAIRVLHEQPILGPIEFDGEIVTLSVINTPIDLDDLNHLWSTQGDVPQRPSVAYEVALAPVVPRARTLPPPLTTGIGLHVRPAAPPSQVTDVDPSTATIVAPSPDRIVVDVTRADWSPRLFLIHGGRGVLTVDLPEADRPGYVPRAAIAGASGHTVRLEWEIWTPDVGWRTVAEVQDHLLTLPVLDPDTPPVEASPTLTLPLDGPGQAVLSATRMWAGPGGIVPRRSNLAVVTVHGQGGP